MRCAINDLDRYYLASSPGWDPRASIGRLRLGDATPKSFQMSPMRPRSFSLATTPTVGEVVERAVREHRIYPVAGDVNRIAHHLYQSALRLS